MTNDYEAHTETRRGYTIRIIQAAGEKVESLREECRALESRLAELKEQPENENQD